MKRILAVLLALALFTALFSSCQKQPETQPTTAEPEKQLTDEEAVAAYLEKLHSGNYSDKYYDYEDLSVYLQLGEYKGVKYPDAPEVATAVSDKETDDFIAFLFLENFASDEDYETLEEGVVQRYDTAVIDYEGYMDGELFEGGSASGTELGIGSGTFIPGFEDGLVGVKIGGTVTLDLQFSPYYSNSDVAGKAVTFRVTVKSVRRAAIPEVTVDQINETWNTTYETYDEFVDAVKSDLSSEQAEKAQDCIRLYLQNRILENSTKSEKMPEKEMQHYRDHFDAYYEQYAEQYGLSLDSFIVQQMGTTREVYDEKREDFARNAVLIDLYTFLIAEKEGLSWTDEQVTALLTGSYQNMASSFGTMQNFIDYYVSVYGTSYFADNVLNNLVNQLVMQSAEKE